MAVKIKRERPDQRRHHRVTAPLFISVGGHDVRATNWSQGGLRIDGFEGDLPTRGDTLPLHLTLPFQGFDVSFDVKSEVVRVDSDVAGFAVRFTEVGERERELMQHFLEELVRGSMVDVEDTIQRIDVPVTPASLEPDKKPVAAIAGPVPVRRWPIKTIVMTSIYAVLGAIVFGYAGLLGYSNFWRLEVQTAVIAAPVDTVTAPADGRVNWTGLKPGDPVKTGDVILQLIDNQLEREIELSDIAIRENKSKFAGLQRRQLEELDRLRGYATMEMKNVLQTRIELEALESQVRIAEENYAQFKILFDKGFTTATLLATAESNVIGLRKQLDIRRVELKSRVELAQQNVGKRVYSGSETVGTSDLIGHKAEIEAAMHQAEQEIQIAQQKLIANLNYRDRLAVRAPFEGTIVDLPRVDKGAVSRGDTIAIIEQRRDRFVMAYLNQDEVLRVGIGDEALLYVPGLNETLKGRVRKIDRTSGFVHEQDQRQTPGYAWRGPTDRSAKVSIDFADLEKVANFDRYRSGLPVVVVFERRSTNALMSALKKQFAIVF